MKPRKDPAQVRLEWLKQKEAKAIADYHFANGYRAGIECAVRAITPNDRRRSRQVRPG